MSPARTYTTELIGNWACGQAGLIKARVHYNSVDKRLEVNSAVTGTGLLTVLRAVVPSLKQAPQQFEALQLTDFTVRRPRGHLCVFAQGLFISHTAGDRRRPQRHANPSSARRAAEGCSRRARRRGRDRQDCAPGEWQVVAAHQGRGGRHHRVLDWGCACQDGFGRHRPQQGREADGAASNSRLGALCARGSLQCHRCKCACKPLW